MLPKDPTRAVAIAVFALAVAWPCAAFAEQRTLTFETPPGDFDPDDPGGGEHGPYDWLENGIRYSGFWYTDVGTPAGSEQRGHTHLGGAPYGGNVGDGPHSWNGALQGGRISLENGGHFRLVSVDYRVEERDVPPDAGIWTELSMRLPWTVPVSDVHLVVSESVDPVAPDFPTFEAQFAMFDIDDGSMLDLGDGTFDPLRPDASLMLQTLPIEGFDDVEEVYLSHTGSLVYLDNIVIDTLPQGVEQPLPGPGLLLAPELACLGAWAVGRRQPA